MKKIILIYILIAIKLIAQDGIFKTKYANGNLKEEVAVVDGIYDGTSYWYYENGLLKSVINFNKGKVTGWVRHYYKSGLLHEEFYVNNGVKDGIAKTYFDNGSLHKVERYENGILVKFNEFTNDPNYIAPPEAYRAGLKNLPVLEEEAICSVEICASPIGGMYSIYENLVYPEEALMYGLEGQVTIEAFISDKGLVERTNILKDIGLGCGKAAEEAIKKTRFIPGKNGDDFVNSDLVLFVKFSMDPKLKEQMKESKIKFVSKKEEVKEIAKQTDVKPIVKEVEPEPLTIICSADVCPKPEIGLTELFNSIEITDRAKRNKITGFIEIEAVIDELGFVRDTKLIKGLGYGLDDSAEFAILTNKFTPAKKNNENVQSKVTFKIFIKL